MKKLKNLMVGILLLTVVGVYAQTKQVTGKVTDATGAPIPGASIKVKGAKSGTSAGADGSFKLTVPPNAVLVVSGIGYELKEVKTGEGSTFSVQLAQDTKALSEVVVTGVGTATSKRKLGIAVESITAEKLPPAPTASIDQALIGKIPGAQISSISGNPGDPVNIVLRGINTIQNGTKPLIMVDGVQVSATDINSLDLSNVERIEVAQGAASASLYGAQGANGVIQVFTKKGKRGTPVINFSTSYASNSYINSGHVHKAQLHPYLTDASGNLVDDTGAPLTYDQYGMVEGISYQYGGATRYAILDTRNVADKPYTNLKYYDHFKELFQTGSTTNNSISITGASDKSDYAITVSNNHTVSPVMKNGYVDRTNLTSNLGTELFKGFKIRSTTQLIYTKNTLTPGLGAAGGYSYGKGNTLGSVGTIFSSLNTSPFFDLKYRLADGTPPAYQEGGTFLSVNAFNPFYQQYYASGLDNKIDIVQSFDANYKVNHFVELDAKYGINYRTENSRWTYLNQSENINSNYVPAWASYFNGSDNTGEIDNWQYNTTFQNFTGSAYIKTDFQNDFHLKIPIQTSTQIAFDYRKNKYTEYDTYGLSLPLAPPINIQSTSSQAVAYDYIEPFITYGFLVNQKIDIGDVAGVAGGFRSDYSSAFGGGSKPFTFPHVDGYILPSAFEFWKNSKLSDVVSYVKVRSAYGEAGIQPGPFDRYPTINQSNLGSQLIYTNPTTNQNSNLQVEVSKEFEVGTDFTINANKGGKWFSAINGSFTYWKRTSSNVIYTINTPLSTGATGLLNNAIDMSSQGIQFQLNLPVVQTKSFTWNFTTNFSHQTSMIDKIAGGSDIPILVDGNSLYESLSAGHKIGQIYAYKAFTSVGQTYQDGKTRYIDPADAGKYDMVNGHVVDTATKSIQFTSEKYNIGDPNPKFNMAFINEFTYKDFLTFSFQFDWVYGSHMYNETKEWMYRDGISGDFSKPVTINGQTGAYTAYWASAYYALFGSLSGAGNDAAKDFFYENSSFLRLRNISIGLDIAKLVKIKYFKKMQLVLTGRNIYTATKYTGFDPEASSITANSSFIRGVDNSSIPNIKSYQVGLNIGF